MDKWILENHPDKVEIFNTCQKLGDMTTEHYWCHHTSGKVVEDLFAEEPQEFVGVFKTTQNGYKMADNTVPYPSEDELIALVDSINVSGEDLKKTKWQLLAEAYINAQ